MPSFKLALAENNEKHQRPIKMRVRLRASQLCVHADVLSAELRKCDYITQESVIRREKIVLHTNHLFGVLTFRGFC